jgi:hypothetical protein
MPVDSGSGDFHRQSRQQRDHPAEMMLRSPDWLARPHPTSLMSPD